MAHKKHRPCTRGRASHLAAAVSQIVAHHLRDSGYTFYRESMLVLGQSRQYVQAHTCARTHKHPCTHTRTHADAHTPTSHTPAGMSNACTNDNTTNCPPPGLHCFYLQHSNVQLHYHFSITSTILQLQ